MTLEELKAEAKKLGIKFDENVTEEELTSLVQEALDKANDNNKDEGESDDLEYLKAEAKKAFEARDAAKKDRRTLLNKIEELEKKLNNAPDPSKLKELESNLKTLSEFRKTVEQEREEEELKQKTEIERAAITHQKTVDELQNKFMSEMEEFKKMMGEKEEVLKQKDSQISVLRENRLEKEIYEAAIRNKAISPTQLVRMLKSDFNYNDKLDSYEHLVYEKGKLKDEMTIDEMVKSFLSKEENANLVEADVNNGSMYSNKTDQTKTKTNLDQRKFGKYDPKDPVIIEKAEDKGLEVPDYIETLLLRDEKLGKVSMSENKSSS